MPDAQPANENCKSAGDRRVLPQSQLSDLLLSAMVLLAVVQCGGSSPPTMEPITTDPVPGYRARIVFTMGESNDPLAWTEIEVQGTSRVSRLMCEALLERDSVPLSSEGLEVQAPPGCQNEPLPSMSGVPDGYLLVLRHVVSEFDLAFLLAHIFPSAEDIIESAQEGDDVSATLTDFTPVPTAEECQRLLAEILTRQRASRVESERAELEFLGEQLERHVRRADQVCAEADEATTRYNDLWEAAGGQISRETFEAEQSRDHMRRECDTERVLADDLRQRIEEGSLPVAEEPEPVCQPYTR